MKKQVKYFAILCIIFSIAANAQIKIGDAMPSIKLKSNTNNEVNITALKGKFVLVDFWASWCAPCRLGNKKLVKLFNTIDKNEIEIIGISLDTDKSKWLKAIEKDKIKFTQLIDPKGFDANTALKFGVEELPSKFLFNSDGILVAKNPSEEEIMKLIKL